VLDRGHGRPRQAVELTGTDAGPVRIEDARARNLALVEAVAERIGKVFNEAVGPRCRRG
jgi:hypothetical protein